MENVPWYSLFVVFMDEPLVLIPELIATIRTYRINKTQSMRPCVRVITPEDTGN